MVTLDAQVTWSKLHKEHSTQLEHQASRTHSEAAQIFRVHGDSPADIATVQLHTPRIAIAQPCTHKASQIHSESAQILRIHTDIALVQLPAHIAITQPCTPSIASTQRVRSNMTSTQLCTSRIATAQPCTPSIPNTQRVSSNIASMQRY